MRGWGRWCAGPSVATVRGITLAEAGLHLHVVVLVPASSPLARAAAPGTGDASPGSSAPWTGAATATPAHPKLRPEEQAKGQARIGKGRPLKGLKTEIFA